MYNTRNNNNPSYVFLKGNTYYFNRHVPLDVTEYNKSDRVVSLFPILAIESLQTGFALYDLIEEAEANGEKVNNYALAKQVDIEVEQRNAEEEWDVAYKRRVASVAVSRKKKVAVDAISNLEKGVFPLFTMVALWISFYLTY